MPDRQLAMKGQECREGKRSKERLTALLCGNATGTDLYRFFLQHGILVYTAPSVNNRFSYHLNVYQCFHTKIKREKEKHKSEENYIRKQS